MGDFGVRAVWQDGSTNLREDEMSDEELRAKALVDMRAWLVQLLLMHARELVEAATKLDERR